MLLVQKWPFFPFFFLGNIGQENLFYDILEPKKHLSSLKKHKVQKVEKLTFFHGFGPKMTIFPTFFFRQYRPGNCVLRYSRTKKHLSRLQKHKVQKVEKLTFFEKSKNGHFSNAFYKAIQAREMCFTIFLKQKTPFQPLKAQSSKSRKMANFPTFFHLAIIGQENVFYDSLEPKNSFLFY